MVHEICDRKATFLDYHLGNQGKLYKLVLYLHPEAFFCEFALLVMYVVAVRYLIYD